MTDMSRNLAANVRRLRKAHNLSQQQMAHVSGLPRPTWASLESGGANPTLAVLASAAQALQVSIEELIGAPRQDIQLYRADEVGEQRRGGARLRPLVPDALPGLEFSRMEIDPGGLMGGVPHTTGTREYLSCESGRIELIVEGQRYVLGRGDMLVFRGDQRHSYRNPDASTPAIAISVVCFAA